MKCVLIEHSPETADTVAYTLRLGWPEITLSRSQSGASGIELVETSSPDVVIIDGEIADMPALDIIRQIRLFSEVPLIIVSDNDNEVDRVKFLEAGGDDFLPKPLSILDLLVRIKALMRRTTVINMEGEDLPPLVAGNLVINFGTRNVLVDGIPVRLTRTEYRLLYILVRNEGKILSHDTLRQRIWGSAEYTDPSCLKKYIHQLRIKLNDDLKNPGVILSERGLGYRFAKPISSREREENATSELAVASRK